MLGSIILNILSGVIPVTYVYFSSRVLNILAEGITSAALSETAKTELYWVILYWSVAAVAGQALTHFGNAVQQLHQKRITTEAQQLIASHAASLDAEHFDDAAFYNELQLASAESTSRPAQCTQTLMRLVSALAGLLTMGLVVLTWQPWLIPLLTIGPIILFFIAAKTSEELRALRDDRAEVDRLAQYCKAVLTGDRTLKDVRLYGLKEFFLQKFASISEDAFQRERDIVTKRFLYRGLPTLLVSLDRPILIGYIAYKCLQGAITIGQFSLYSQALSSFQSQLRAIGSALAQLQEASVYSRSLFSFLNRKPQIERIKSGNAVALPDAPPSIEFRAVSFTYPGTSRRILKNVNFTVSPGEIVAIVGRNGSGKTTIGKLMGRLYEPATGDILFSNVSAADLDLDFLRSQLGFVSQDHNIFDLSVRENIALSDCSSSGDRERVVDASTAVGFDALVRRLPDGYDTILGRNRNGGHELSGGQKQLLVLARAWYRNAPIMVLDEPSSSLDVVAEQKNLQLWLEARRAGNRVTILISHRLPMVQHADRILVLDDGVIVEEGAHARLLERRGLYAKMYTAQINELPKSALTTAC